MQDESFETLPSVGTWLGSITEAWDACMKVRSMWSAWHEVQLEAPRDVEPQISEVWAVFLISIGSEMRPW